MSWEARSSEWQRLFRVACALIRQVNAEHLIIDYWSLGGGTALMLQIDHRESHDIDIFLTDPQLLPFLDPQKHNFDFEILPTAYHGDGASFLKLAFAPVGEIDFIVRPAMTESPVSMTKVDGEQVWLETIPEIITKKVFYRGAMIMPRDIFDIAAAGRAHAEAMIEQLKNYPEAVARTLLALERANPEFMRETIARLAIKPRYKDVAASAVEGAKETLRAV